MEVRLERLSAMRAAHVHSFSESPEEDSWTKIETWAKSQGLFDEHLRTRVFGRNTYPTTEPEPHGYEFFLTVGNNVEPGDGIDILEIQSGLYAVLRVEGLHNLGEAWKRMWDFIEVSEYEHIGWRKGNYGWYDGFEENLTPLERDPAKWIFDVWVQLKE
ncbi:MAG: GyrI-like domain-containing protein [Candidatus Bathyarchaeota archaeon]|nr:MAG: GyrI-like domain-containing protein [Candidatus Bathyarchaeota archaeon]